MNYTVILRRPDSVGDDYRTVIQHVNLDSVPADEVAAVAEAEAREVTFWEDVEANRMPTSVDDYQLVAVFAGHHVALAVGD